MMLDKETQQFITEHTSHDVRDLALKSTRYPSVNMKFALQQIAGRQKAKYKIPSWYKNERILYPAQLSMEQCSSESTALYKASLCKGNNIFIDLTGGFGIDFSFIARSYKEAIYIEQQKELVELARHNFALLNLQQAIIEETNSQHFLQQYNSVADTIFIDPARRSSSGKKTVLIEDCAPNLVELNQLLNQKSKMTIIKLSPMLDITHAIETIDNISDIHVVSINNECKELLFIKQGDTTNAQKIHCVNIISKDRVDLFTFSKEQEYNILAEYTSNIAKYLYEPNSSILKAGGYKSIGFVYKLKKLHPNSHLYTSDVLFEEFPGRVFMVEKNIYPNKKEIKTYLKNIKQANITTRNYPLSVAEIKKLLKIKDGSENYIFATTLFDERKTLILCKRIPSRS